MPEGRTDATAVRLGDGRVLLAGGILGSSFFGTASAETYTPATDSWTPVPSMSLDRDGGMGIALQDGRALVVGGWCFASPPDCSSGASNTAEVFDPASNTWTSAGTPTDQGVVEGSLTVLKDGRVLLAGGDACNVQYCEGTAASYLYDPSTNSWSSTGSMHEARALPASFLLSDGRVLIVGGVCDQGNCDTTPAATAEIFDPAEGTWTYAAKPLITPGLPTLIDAGDHVTPLLLGAGSVVQKYDVDTDSWSLALPSSCDFGTDTTGETHAARFGSSSTMVVGIMQCRNVSPTIAMLYRPGIGWVPTTTNYDHFVAYALVTLADGKVLLAGGGGGDGTDPPAAKAVEIFG